MSILTEILPEHLVVSGSECPIKSDFRVWLQFSELISNGNLTKEKIVKIFRLIFGELLPPNMYEGLKAIFEFYSHETQTKKAEAQVKKQSFDFDYDAELIYSAFMQQYNIDLCNADMHWWKFKSLLNGLSENTHFVQAIQYRTIDISQVKDKEMKKHYKKMKSLYKLPDKRSEEQKEQDLYAEIESLF